MAVKILLPYLETSKMDIEPSELAQVKRVYFGGQMPGSHFPATSDIANKLRRGDQAVHTSIAMLKREAGGRSLLYCV